MQLSLTGKHALIGGSTQGIGLAIAQELALLGATCTLISRNESSLQKAVTTLNTDQQQQHDYLVADYSNYEEVKEVVAAYVAKNNIHILINNSGGPAAGPITEATPEAFFSAFQQHLICNQLITQLVIPGMKTDNYGRIVNVISTSVKIPLKGLGVSNTIRGAVASWAKTMSNELAPFGITVNNILPGATATARLETIVNNKSAKTGHAKDAVEQEMIDEIPMKRFGQPGEIGAVAAFLTTPAAAYLTGVSIPVDGGRTGSL
ncbi:SDR family oxidoreductase [Taibaiella lutea]|uniref:SDR family oxidoreductase n=1 Tax=Taibaiella lutea TaxID=2608001 RepID=A0A5M6CWL1_9BACT|nr:SDR family oxidoreductase [Taibaiella lutea]KAA5537295.1 SDR family oxidoreductase [Taibaiella lutea]